MASKVEGLASLKARMLRTLPAAAKAKMKAANQKNAAEFKQLVERIIPRDEGAHPRHPPGALAATLVQEEVGETGASVSVGGPAAPYPLHLTAGHRAADGTHVPAKDFWNAPKRVLKKRGKARNGRALREAVKIAAAGKLGAS